MPFPTNADIARAIEGLNAGMFSPAGAVLRAIEEALNQAAQGQFSPQSFDAMEWVAEFRRINGDNRPDDGTMLGWFANAIMAGHDEAMRRIARDNAELGELREDRMALCSVLGKPNDTPKAELIRAIEVQQTRIADL